MQAPDSYDRRESPLEQGGSNPLDILKRMQELGQGSILEDIRTLGQLADGGVDTIIDSAKNQIKDGLTNAVLGALGLGGDTNTPTNASTPSIVNIANQGTVTGANSSTQAENPPNAGTQT